MLGKILKACVVTTLALFALMVFPYVAILIFPMVIAGLYYLLIP